MFALSVQELEACSAQAHHKREPTCGALARVAAVGLHEPGFGLGSRGKARVAQHPLESIPHQFGLLCQPLQVHRQAPALHIAPRIASLGR